MKICSACKIEKSVNLFYVRRDGATEKPSSRCKSCVSVKTKERKKKLSENWKFYSSPNPCRKGHVALRLSATGDCIECYRIRDAHRSLARNRTAERKEYFNNWRQANPENISANQKKYATSDKGRAAMKASFSKRYSTDLNFKAKCALRNLLRRVFVASGERKSLKTQDALGYDTDQLRSRIGCQFRKGMDWSNYGEWEIDHKKPVARFIAQGVTDAKVINALCNLQPLWQHENRVKSDKYAS